MNTEFQEILGVNKNDLKYVYQGQNKITKNRQKKLYGLLTCYIDNNNKICYHIKYIVQLFFGDKLFAEVSDEQIIYFG